MMNLLRRKVGVWSLNTYVLICSATRQSVLVDPGAEPDTLQNMLEGTRPKAILITHSHPDHIGSLDTMSKHLDVPVMAHPGNRPEESPVRADQWLAHGDDLVVGRLSLHVYHTPGHTEDQICLAVNDCEAILVGDTLFDGGPGKTWSVQGFQQTLKTLGRTVIGWPDTAALYPGHGPQFRLGDRRSAIEQFLQKEHGDFYGDAVWDM